MLIYAALTVLWMAVIFWFSANNSADSDSMSSALLEKLLSVFVPHWKTMTMAERVRLLKQLHHGFRKLGHFTEFAVLGGLLSQTMHSIFRSDTKNKRLRPHRRAVMLSAAAALLYAASDEFHQLFVDGRSGSITDVLIDFAGACTGILLSLLICAAVYRLRVWWIRRKVLS